MIKELDQPKKGKANFLGSDSSSLISENIGINIMTLNWFFCHVEESDAPSSTQRFIVVDQEVLLECQSLSS